MKRSLAHRPSASERVLMTLHPLWSLATRVFPSLAQAPKLPAPHPSAMLTEFNWCYRLIFPRFFARISVDDAAVERLRAISRDATVVYCTRVIGQLEYSYFNQLLLSQKLPLARYANGLTQKRWMKPRDYWRAICKQEREITEYGRPLDVIADSQLVPMLKAGQSVLIRIPPAELEDDDLFYTGSLRALADLLTAQRTSERPIVVVPLDFLWSRRPPKSKRSTLDLLFGEKENPGRLRKFILFWRNYKRRAQAVIGAPIPLAQFVTEGENEIEQAKHVRARLVSGLALERRIVTGPPQKPRSWFLHQVVSDDMLDRFICETAVANGKPADDLRSLAERYANEIVADLDYTYIELLERLMGRTLLRLFEGLDIDEAGLTRLRELMAKGPVVLVPNHKSHADYLILSYILYHRGLPAPYITAGANMSFWPLGRIFRRCGAYFIRRSFRGNELYRMVLQTYLKVLLREGCCQEFFIEGGRSRSGKLREPKMGMLRMLTQASKEAGIQHVQYVPVTFTYDRVIEHRSYDQEQQGGNKERESTGQLFRLTKFLRQRAPLYGSIFVRFGPALTIEDTGNERGDVAKLAHEICHELNRRIVVTPAAVAAASLLATGRAGIREQEFERTTQALLQGLIAKGVEVPLRLQGDARAVLAEALQQLAIQKLVVSRKDAIIPFWAIDESRRIPLAYYRNGIVHFLATAGTVAALLLFHRSQGKIPPESVLAQELKESARLFHHELRFATSRAAVEHASKALQVLEAAGCITRNPDGTVSISEPEVWRLEAFAAQIRPFAEALFVGIHALERHQDTSMDDRTIITGLIRAGEDLLLLEGIRYREGMTKEAFQHVIATLIDAKLITVEEVKDGNRIRRQYHFTHDAVAIQNLKVTLERLL